MTQRGNHIGTLIKPHGYKGELLLKGKPQFLDKITKGIPLFIEISEQRIPFFIENFSLDISGEKGITKFEFIDSDLEARKYLGCEVFTDIAIDVNPDHSFKIKEYVGFTVYDMVTGIEYRVKDFYDSAENPILVLENKGVELLLPRNADYIFEIDIEEKIMKAEFPEGLAV